MDKIDETDKINKVNTKIKISKVTLPKAKKMARLKLDKL